MANNQLSTGRFITCGAFTVGDKRTIGVDAVLPWTVTIPNGTTDLLKVLPVKFSALQAIALHASDVCKIETNNGTTPTDTINLAANKGVIWFVGETGCPFTADCTNVYITNTSGSSVEIRAIIAYTP